MSGGNVAILLNQCINLVGSGICLQRVVHPFCYARLHTVAYVLQQGVHAMSQYSAVLGETSV